MGPAPAPRGSTGSRRARRWVALALTDSARWAAFARLIGRGDLADDPLLSTEPGRRSRADEIDAVIRDWVRVRDPHAATEELRRCGVAAARVAAPGDLLDDRHLEHRGFWEKVAHPVAGTFLSTGMPFRLESVAGNWVRSPARCWDSTTATYCGRSVLTPSRSTGSRRTV